MYYIILLVTNIYIYISDMIKQIGIIPTSIVQNSFFIIANKNVKENKNTVIKKVRVPLFNILYLILWNINFFKKF